MKTKWGMGMAGMALGCVCAGNPALAVEDAAPRIESGMELRQAQAWCEGARPGSTAELGKDEGGDSTLRCLIDGVAEGTGFAWYPNRALSARGTYSSGTKQGTWRHYYPDGTLKDEGEYRAGKREGEWKFWTAGVLEPEIRQYRDGEPVVADDPTEDRSFWGLRAGVHSAWSPGQTNYSNSSVTPRLDPSITLVYEADRYESGMGRLRTTLAGGWMGASNDLSYTNASGLGKLEEYRANFAFASFGQHFEPVSDLWVGAELGVGLSLNSKTDVWTVGSGGARALDTSRGNGTELGIYPAFSALYSFPLRTGSGSLELGLSGIPPFLSFSYFTAFAGYMRRF